MTTRTTITPRQAAKLLDVSTQAVYELIHRGVLPRVNDHSFAIPEDAVLERMQLPTDNQNRRIARPADDA